MGVEHFYHVKECESAQKDIKVIYFDVKSVVDMMLKGMSNEYNNSSDENFKEQLRVIYDKLSQYNDYLGQMTNDFAQAISEVDTLAEEYDGVIKNNREQIIASMQSGDVINEASLEVADEDVQVDTADAQVDAGSPVMEAEDSSVYEEEREKSESEEEIVEETSQDETVADDTADVNVQDDSDSDILEDVSGEQVIEGVSEPVIKPIIPEITIDTSNLISEVGSEDEAEAESTDSEDTENVLPEEQEVEEEPKLIIDTGDSSSDDQTIDTSTEAEEPKLIDTEGDLGDESTEADTTENEVEDVADEAEEIEKQVGSSDEKADLSESSDEQNDDENSDDNVAKDDANGDIPVASQDSQVQVVGETPMESVGDALPIYEPGEFDQTASENIKFVKSDSLEAKVIVVTEAQVTNLRQSRDTQDALLTAKGFYKMPSESKSLEDNGDTVEENAPSKEVDDVSEQQLIDNGLLPQDLSTRIQTLTDEANQLYADGKLEEAQARLDEISELSKQLKEEQPVAVKL